MEAAIFGLFGVIIGSLVSALTQWIAIKHKTNESRRLERRDCYSTVIAEVHRVLKNVKELASSISGVGIDGNVSEKEDQLQLEKLNQLIFSIESLSEKSITISLLGSVEISKIVEQFGDLLLEWLRINAESAPHFDGKIYQKYYTEMDRIEKIMLRKMRNDLN